MKHTRVNCTAWHLILAGKCGLQCGNCLACKCGECSATARLSGFLKSDKNQEAVAKGKAQEAVDRSYDI